MAAAGWFGVDAGCGRSRLAQGSRLCPSVWHEWLTGVPAWRGGMTTSRTREPPSLRLLVSLRSVRNSGCQLAASAVPVLAEFCQRRRVQHDRPATFDRAAVYDAEALSEIRGRTALVIEDRARLRLGVGPRIALGFPCRLVGLSRH